MLALLLAGGGGMVPGALAGQEPATGLLYGSVVDELTRGPLASAAVTLTAAGDTVVRASVLTDREGRFRLAGLPDGEYRVGFRRLGSTDASASVRIGAGARSVDLGVVTLAPLAIEIEEVSVVAERPAVVYAPDRDIYSAEAIPGAAGGSATDVLGGVPDLEVDPSGRVTMRGESPQIYINGRPAPMRGESLDVFLQQFSAENIESVEVMANPSARYEAEGTGGIVNIVLKRDARLGLNGSVFANGGTRGDLGAGGRATYQAGPLTLIGGSSLRLSRRETSRTDLRQNLLADPITYLEQRSLSDRSTASGSLDLTTRYALGERTTLTAETRASRNTADADRETFYAEMDAALETTESYTRSALDDSEGLSVDVALELEHAFVPRRHELTAELSVARGSDTETSLVRRRLLEDEALDHGVELTFDDARDSDSEARLRVDYNLPWGEAGQLETGFRIQVGETDERQERALGYGDPSDGLSLTSPTGFVHRQTVHSFYATAVRRLGALNVQAGVRAERTGIRLEAIGGEGFDADYLGIFPNVNLTLPVGEGRRLRASYSVRVRRPSARVLNPTDRSTDPLDRRVGNPDIQPQYTHNVGLDANWSGSVGSLRLSPFYRQSVDEWVQLKTVDADGVSTTTWENLASTASYGTSLTASVREVRGMGGSVNLTGQRQERAAIPLLSQPARASTHWSVRTNLNGRVTSDLTVQGSLRYNPARELAQGRASSTLMTTLGVRQRLLGNRATVNLNLNDPFDLYRSSVETTDRTHVEIGRERESMRRVALSLSYNFGGAGGRARGGGGGRGR